MAYVAMERLESVMRFSMSRLQAVTAWGWVMASLFSVLMAENLRTGLGEERKSWRTTKDQPSDTNKLGKSIHPQQVGTGLQY